MAVLGQQGGDTGLPNMIFLETETWTAPANFEGIIYVIGGGGSGGAVEDYGDWSVSGGGAGGCAVSRYSFIKDTAYVFTIGNGGSVTDSWSGGAYAVLGSNGGNTTAATGGSTFMTGNGGQGGQRGDSTSCAGGTGGSSSGGNLMNNTGGAGGAVDATRKVSGGGAVGLFKTGNAAQAGIYSGLWYGGYSHGGTLNGYDWADGIGEFVTQYVTGWGESTPVSMSPFPDLVSFTTGQDGNRGYKDSTSHENVFQTLACDMQGDNSGAWDYQHSASIKYTVKGPPFCGTSGICSGYATHYGGAACLGGGSGAVMQNTTGDTHAGRGGDGCVMIFPTKIS